MMVCRNFSMSNSLLRSCNFFSKNLYNSSNKNFFKRMTLQTESRNQYHSHNLLKKQEVCDDQISKENNNHGDDYKEAVVVKPSGISINQSEKKFFVTTPIYYVNGMPHIGHLYTSLIADVIVRWGIISKVASAKNYLFTSGTDEHGSKVDKSSQNEIYHGDTLKYCNEISRIFKKLLQDYNICANDFIRTTEPRHKHFVQQVWNYLKNESKDIYESTYEGWYCQADEAFVNQVVKNEDGVMLSAESMQPCEWIVEKNYKFKLSKYIPGILNWLEKDSSIITPKERYNEIVSILRQQIQKMSELRNKGITDFQEFDLSVSRPSSRVKWGIPVPNDPHQTIYVWLDALSNYLTVSVQDLNSRNMQHTWPPDYHIIGKDILKFHALYWPAFLLALQMPLPKKLVVHSHWTVNREKMSKSRGNVQCPFELAHRYAGEPEYIRFYLLHEGQILSDANFSHDHLPFIVNSVADLLGNLITRTFGAKLRQPKFKNEVILFPECIDERDQELLNSIQQHTHEAIQSYNQNSFRDAIESALKILKNCNQWYDEKKPWIMMRQIKKEKIESAERENLEKKLQTLKYIVTDCIRISVILLYPIMPTKMNNILMNWMGLQDQDIVIDKLSFRSQWNNDHINTIQQNLLEENPPIFFPKIVQKNSKKSE